MQVVNSMVGIPVSTKSMLSFTNNVLRLLDEQFHPKTLKTGDSSLQKEEILVSDYNFSKSKCQSTLCTQTAKLIQLKFA